MQQHSSTRLFTCLGMLPCPTELDIKIIFNVDFDLKRRV